MSCKSIVDELDAYRHLTVEEYIHTILQSQIESLEAKVKRHQGELAAQIDAADIKNDAGEPMVAAPLVDKGDVRMRVRDKFCSQAK